MTRQRLDYKEGLYAESLVVVVTEAFVTLILRRVRAKHLIGIGAHTTSENSRLSVSLLTISIVDDVISLGEHPDTTPSIGEAIDTVVDLIPIPFDDTRTRTDDAIDRTGILTDNLRVPDIVSSIAPMVHQRSCLGLRLKARLASILQDLALTDLIVVKGGDIERSAVNAVTGDLSIVPEDIPTL